MSGFVNKVPDGATLRYERVPKVPNKGYAFHVRIYDGPNGCVIVERLQPSPRIWWTNRTADEWVGLQRNRRQYLPQ